MGMNCPNGHGWQPIIQNITKDGLGARKATDVLAHRLGCQCVIGGEVYNEFITRANEIDAETANEILELQREAQQKKAALWKTMSQEGVK